MSIEQFSADTHLQCFCVGSRPGKVEQFAICPCASEHAPIEPFVYILQHSCLVEGKERWS